MNVYSRLTRLADQTNVSRMEREPALLTVGEVAEQFRVHSATVGRWIRDGALDAIRTPGGQYRVRRKDVEALLSGAPA